MDNHPDIEEGSQDKLIIMPLGAGKEVGRSCIMVKFHNSTVLLDLGIHPAYDNMGGLPFLDAIDVSTVDLLLISHFHNDHVVGVPYFLQHTLFQGKCFMTEQTKAIAKITLGDYVRVSPSSKAKPLFTQMDLDDCQAKITAVNFHKTNSHKGIKSFVIQLNMLLVFVCDFQLDIEKYLHNDKIIKITLYLLIIKSIHC
jgi:cleavage and polyadenylation specificity factor subunit 3